MASHKRLNSVSHSIAHIAASGSYSGLSLDLGVSCTDEDWRKITLDLLLDDPCPAELQDNIFVRQLPCNLKETLNNLLHRENWSVNDLTEAKLTLYFQSDGCQDGINICKVVLIDLLGKRHEAWVDGMGRALNECARAMLDAPSADTST